MRKLSLVLSLAAVFIAAIGAAVAIAMFLSRKKEEEEFDFDDTDLLTDDELDYYQAQVGDESAPAQAIVDDTHPQEHGTTSEQA